MSDDLIAETRRLLEARTPGEWVALQNDGTVAGVTLLLHPETQHDIAHCETPGRQDAGANAELIARSPSLLESLAASLEAKEKQLRSVEAICQGTEDAIRRTPSMQDETQRLLKIMVRNLRFATASDPSAGESVGGEDEEEEPTFHICDNRCEWPCPLIPDGGEVPA